MKFFLLLALIGLSYQAPGVNNAQGRGLLSVAAPGLPGGPSSGLFDGPPNQGVLDDFNKNKVGSDEEFFEKLDKMLKGSNPTSDTNENPTPDVPFNKADCSCRLRSTSRIVNGQVVEPNSIPWQVSLASWGQHFCGASIINNQYILTAAHCVTGKSAIEIEVRVGLHHLDDADLESKTHKVERIFQHHFTTPSEAGDIAILKLKKPIEFSKNQVEPACFNTVAKEYNDKLMASGWGTTSVSVKHANGELKTGDVSPVLKQAYFKEDRSGCEKYLICIDSDNRDSVCQGDSGGPLHHTENGKTTVDGVASFVSGVGRIGGPVEMCTGAGAYSRLSYYKKWFENIVGDNYCTLN